MDFAGRSEVDADNGSASKIAHKKWLIRAILLASTEIASENAGYFEKAASKSVVSSSLCNDL